MSVGSYAGVRVVGGLLPLDLLPRLSSGGDVPGLTPGDYHLAGGESRREAANRAWSYLTGVWATFRAARDRLPETDRATSLTRERWLLVLLRELGFGRVPVTGAGGLSADGKAFPVSHAWEQVPVHLLGWRVDLDRRSPGVAGAADASPQSLVQELLNRSDGHLWGLLSNGRVLRLLRDSTSLVGSAYVEFVAEDITSRFLNVISLFNGFIPLIAIELRAITVGDLLTLHATKVVDVTILGGEEDDEELGQSADRGYWESARGRPSTVALADRMLELIRDEVDPGLTLKYNKHYIGLARDGVPDNFIAFRARKQHLVAEFRIPRSEELTARLEEAGLDQLEYNTHWRRYRLRLTSADIAAHQDVLRNLVRQASSVGSGSD